jgi:hypothetical protein
MKWYKCSEILPELEGKILVLIENEMFIGEVLKHTPLWSKLGIEVNYILGTGNSSGFGYFKESPYWRKPSHFKEPSHWTYIPDTPKKD